MTKTYYLIDFENVKSDGVAGICSLTAEDEVFLFYTKNADKIDISLLEALRDLKAAFHVVSVTGGKQALDNQLDSYLGYLIGINGSNAEYNIVSKDKGFHVMQDFWPDYKVNIRSSIGADIESRTKEQSLPSGNKKNTTEDKPYDKAAINNVIQKVLSQNGLDAGTINSVASIASNNLHDSKSGKQLVYRAIIKKYGQKRGLEIYNIVKPSIHALLK